MSTKIYNGYLLSNIKKEEVNSFLDRIKPLFFEEQNKQCAKFFIMKRLYSLDRNQFLGYKVNTFEDIQQDFNERVQELKKGYRDPVVDFSANVFYIPTNNKILALFYCDNAAMVKLWQQQNKVKDYHYQNQTDHPSSISEKEWKQRQTDWDEALIDGIPANNPDGVSYCFTTEECENVTQENVKKYFNQVLIDMNQRINSVVLDMMFNYWSKNISTEEKFDYVKAQSWIRSEDGQVMIEKFQITVSQQIKEYISYDDLFN